MLRGPASNHLAADLGGPCQQLVTCLIPGPLDTTINTIVRDLTATIADLRNRTKSVRFSELAKVCERYFGEPRQKGGSHRVYRMPWPGDPRVNIQDAKGMAKPYQVMQVIRALERLETEGREEHK